MLTWILRLFINVIPHGRILWHSPIEREENQRIQSMPAQKVHIMSTRPWIYEIFKRAAREKSSQPFVVYIALIKKSFSRITKVMKQVKMDLTEMVFPHLLHNLILPQFQSNKLLVMEVLLQLLMERLFLINNIKYENLKLLV